MTRDEGDIVYKYPQTINDYIYDEINRLTSWKDKNNVTTNYSYDPAGNLTQKGSTSYTYNGANQITNLGFTYDENGNMTSDGQKDYEYNVVNQLARV